MSDQHHPVVVDAGDPVGEILQTFRAPTGPWKMSRARRLARAAYAAALSLPEVAQAASVVTSSAGDAQCALKAITVDAAQTGGYDVEVRLFARADAPPDLTRALAQQVREAAEERGLGAYVDNVSIVVDGLGP